MVGSDHFHQLWLDNMPQFLVGHAEQYDANWYNEEREFGLPRMRMQGDRDLSGYLLREGLDAGFDLAFSNELRIDRGEHDAAVATERSLRVARDELAQQRGSLAADRDVELRRGSGHVDVAAPRERHGQGSGC